MTPGVVPDAGLTLGLLAAVALLAAVGRRLGLPDPIVFALGGLALAVVPGIPPIALPPSLVPHSIGGPGGGWPQVYWPCHLTLVSPSKLVIE